MHFLVSKNSDSDSDLISFGPLFKFKFNIVTVKNVSSVVMILFSYPILTWFVLISIKIKIDVSHE